MSRRVSAGTFTTDVRMNGRISLVLPEKIKVAVFLKTGQTENPGAAPRLSYSRDTCCEQGGLSIVSLLVNK